MQSASVPRLATLIGSLLVVALLLYWRTPQLSAFAFPWRGGGKAFSRRARTLRCSPAHRPHRNVFVVTPVSGLREGLCGQALMYLLQTVRYLEVLGYTPKRVRFDITTEQYGPLFPDIIKPNVVVRATDNEDRVELGFDYRENGCVVSFEAAHHTFFRFFSIPLMDRRDYFICEPRTLGLHFRGSDKNTDPSQTNAMSQDEFVTLAIAFAAQVEAAHIFVCSDEPLFEAAVKAVFPDMSISSNRVRLPKSDTPYWMNRDVSAKERASSAVRDMLSLATCGWILKSMSALSAWAKVINPKVQVRQVSASKVAWFPTGKVELMRCAGGSKREREILVDHSVGHKCGRVSAMDN